MHNSRKPTHTHNPHINIHPPPPTHTHPAPPPPTHPTHLRAKKTIKAMHCARYRSANTHASTQQGCQLTQLLDAGVQRRLAILRHVTLVGAGLPIMLHVLHLCVADSHCCSTPASHQVTQCQHRALLHLQALQRHRQGDRISPWSNRPGSSYVCSTGQIGWVPPMSVLLVK